MGDRWGTQVRLELEIDKVKQYSGLWIMWISRLKIGMAINFVGFIGLWLSVDIMWIT